jgi:hypothetical protein
VSGVDEGGAVAPEVTAKHVKHGFPKSFYYNPFVERAV